VSNEQAIVPILVWNASLGEYSSIVWKIDVVVYNIPSSFFID